MGSKADEYRQRADEAEEWANNTGDAEDRKKFEYIAEQWRELAKREASRSGGVGVNFELPSNPKPEDTCH